jgi:hypothetical protein
MNKEIKATILQIAFAVMGVFLTWYFFSVTTSIWYVIGFWIILGKCLKRFVAKFKMI